MATTVPFGVDIETLSWPRTTERLRGTNNLSQWLTARVSQASAHATPSQLTAIAG